MDNMKKVYLALATVAACSSAQAMEVYNNGDASLSIGGYVEAEGVFTDNEATDENSFDGTAKQSRVNVKASKMVNGQKVTGVVEGDFYGTGNKTFRLRHAYMQAGNYTLGQTWSGQFLSVYPQLSEQVDFANTAIGTMGAGNVRPDLVLHYANNGVRLTAQDPAYNDANYPDLLASYTGKAGNLGYNIAAMAREAQSDANDSEMGYGVSLAGKYKIGNGSLHASAFTGEGVAPYSNVGVGGYKTKVDYEDGELVSQVGYTVGYKQQLTDKLRGNLYYGAVDVDDKADSSIQYVSANMIYAYAPEIDFGVEVRQLTNETAGNSNDTQQVELSAKYKF
ncbi:MAG: hypothetical protein CSA42_04095 [Gammaproteobacteria bacterium]|nr:MAG: hypothetical protein CSA42_04095 [Gammaproteobacteria bacterium]